MRSRRNTTIRTLGNCVRSGNFGVSPPKQGRKDKIPSELTRALAVQSAMMQVSGEGDASAPKMLTTLNALIYGTEWEEQVNIDYLWRRARKDHLEIMNPVRAKNSDDRRVDWLTYKNVRQWNGRAKKFLIDIGMAKDEPGLIRELSFIM